jgi:hypothetical protein
MREPYRWCETSAETRDADLGSNVSSDIVSLRGGIETCRAVNAVMVEQRDCRHSDLNSALYQLFRL